MTRFFSKQDAIGVKLADNLHRPERSHCEAPKRIPDDIFQAASKNGFFIARTPVYMERSLEILHYFRQQSICNNLTGMGT
jgi:RHH-type proline utilization regulon transcriptional repressor/proline dehydrogenase/delta 1-pyrroline-5-carboxylate dehydrogenase